MAAVEYEKRDGHVVVITMNRPERLNGIDEEMLAGLRDSWLRFSNDDDAWVAVLTGAGRAFTAGADKSWFEKAQRGESTPEQFLDLTAQDLYWSGRLDKPVITAVNGLVVGAGVDLTLRSDLRVAAESAWFQQAEVQRGNFMLFNDNLPHAIAAELTAGFRIPARRAYEVGMVNRVAPDDKVMDAAMEVADGLLSRVPLAVFYALKTLRDMKNVPAMVPRRLLNHYTTVVSNSLMNTEDYKEATTAMLEKRKPVFKKR
jgi:enoyl-CoA hydratase/carnithine racemase